MSIFENNNVSLRVFRSEDGVWALRAVWTDGEGRRHTSFPIEFTSSGTEEEDADYVLGLLLKDQIVKNSRGISEDTVTILRENLQKHE